MKKMLILLLLFGLTGCQTTVTPDNNEETTPVEEVQYEITENGIDFLNGDTYVGDVQNELMHGVGILTFANGDVYEGQFMNGVFEGNGTYTYSDGTYYVGEWVNNVQEGFGEYYVDDREYYTGDWAQGLMNGEGIYYYSPDERIEGNFKDGHPYGECYEYFRFSKMFVGEFIDFDNTEFGYHITIDGELAKIKKVDGEWVDYVTTPNNPTDDGLTLKGSYDIIDFSIYDMSMDSINLYEVSGSDVSYIKVDEMLTLVQNSITRPSVEYEDDLVISIAMGLRDRSLFGYDYYLYKMKLNAEENTIWYSNIDMAKVISNSSKGLGDNSQTRMISFESVGGEEEVIIDLDDYDIDIKVHEGQYLVPLYMVDFIFPRTFMLYEMDDSVIAIDQEGAYFDNFKDEINENQHDASEEMIGLTKSYLRMVFDYQYGLKDFNNLDEIQMINNLSDASVEALHRDIGQMIYDLDDNHTNVINGGYADYGYRGISRYFEDFYNEYLVYTDEPTATVYGDVTVIQFDSFSSYQVFKVVELLQEVETPKVALDIRANGGGAVGSAVYLLTYISEEPVRFNNFNTHTGAEELHEYKLLKGERPEGIEYSLFISNHTFSAANLFTSVFNDMELGQIIGTDSLGGACVVHHAVLPTGMIIRHSGTDALFNIDGEIVEDGIAAHIYVDAPESDLTYVETLVSKIN